MQYFEYHHQSEVDLEEIKQIYPGLFHGLSEESIRARYFLFQYFDRRYGILPDLEKDVYGKPMPVQVNMPDAPVYWSISHTSNWVSFLVSDIQCGIDIEIYRERDLSLLESHTDAEYRLIGHKDWNAFYTLWTAKEAIIKRCSHQLDDMKWIHLVRFDDTELVFSFLDKEFLITSFRFQDVFISFTVS